MNVICTVLNAFIILVFVRVILSWFPTNSGFIGQVQHWVSLGTDWIMEPLRRVIPPIGFGGAALDISPLIILLGVTVLMGLIGC